MNHQTTSAKQNTRRLKIGLLGLSDPAPVPAQLLEALDFCDVVVSPLLSEPATGRQRAEIWNQWMKDGSFDWIFDVSGGNLSTLALPWLDLSLYRYCRTIFAGYSDLTPVLNALVQASGRPCLLFSARQNVPALRSFLKDQDPGLLEVSWEQAGAGEDRQLPEAPVFLGGNIRCLLKLAGTPWWPELTGKVLFLEANSGNAFAIASMVAQLVNMGVMDQIAGLALGQFTQLGDPLPVVQAVLAQLERGQALPLLRTRDVGHAQGSLGLWIGKEYHA